MPAPKSPDTERLTLSNGLDVVLCHAPRLKRAAASLRVAAGSHDVPARWPGLAHFLEHLFFLGTARFAGEQNLMSFVQRHGGQINASTRERTTDFFFELPPSVFAAGVERLCDMLARPRLDFAEQLREREVLHAEFIAWSRDREARHQVALLEPINPQHPLRGFHAGNRYSLAVPNPAFQQALTAFYARFYQAGQLTLCLSGPQPLAALRKLATRHGVLFSTGETVARPAPPPLLSAQVGGPVRQQVDMEHRLHLLSAFEELPPKADEAVAFVCHWLNTLKRGGLAAELIGRGLITSLKAAPLYQFSGQLLLDIELRGADACHRDAIAGLLFSWLTFLRARWAELVGEYCAVQQRRLQTCGALELAHHYCRGLTETLSDTGAAALSALFEQLTPDALIGPRPKVCDSDTVAHWQLPPPNPFLSVAPGRCVQDGRLPVGAVVFHPIAAIGADEAAIFLRWALATAQPRAWQLINVSLHGIIDDARQAGVSLSLSAHGRFWQLKLTGIAQPMAAIVEQVMAQLPKIDAEALAHFKDSETERLIPIRQLLKVLPDRLLTSGSAPQASDPEAMWSGARWSALAVGFAPPDQPAISAALSATPGAAQAASPAPIDLPAGKRWLYEPADSSEDAVLVFCPTPQPCVADEAAWRLLGHLLQGPFYQHLRVDLQLGYAVFSGLRQIGGRTGLLFGVQSPACAAEDLVRHIERFLEGLPGMVEAADLDSQKQALIAQFDPLSLPNEQLAELLWQAHLAGHDGHYPEQLRSALAELDAMALARCARALANGASGWLILANRAAPATSGSLPER